MKTKLFSLFSRFSQRFAFLSHELPFSKLDLDLQEQVRTIVNTPLCWTSGETTDEKESFSTRLEKLPHYVVSRKRIPMIRVTLLADVKNNCEKMHSKAKGALRFPDQFNGCSF